MLSSYLSNFSTLGVSKLISENLILFSKCVTYLLTLKPTNLVLILSVFENYPLDCSRTQANLPAFLHFFSSDLLFFFFFFFFFSIRKIFIYLFFNFYINL